MTFQFEYEGEVYEFEDDDELFAAYKGEYGPEYQQAAQQSSSWSTWSAA